MGHLVSQMSMGVLTDSKINSGQGGEEIKSFDVKDGHGIVEWRKKAEQDFVIITYANHGLLIFARRNSV